MNVVRRRFLLEPGEPLLLLRSTIGTAVRYRMFAEASGLTPSTAILSSTLCSIPLPIYTNFGTNAQGRERRRWAWTRPEFMWHPLMWLPPRVAGRYQIADHTGQGRMEDDDLWAIRVAFEMTASGLYDPDSGTWLDILSTVGLDITDELDLARVQDWLDGSDDEILDDIDLSDYLDIDPTSWAVETALAMRNDLTYGSWALIADDLLGMVADTIDPAYDLPHRDTLIALRTVGSLGETLLSVVPATNPEGVSTGTTHESHAEFFGRMYATADPANMTPDRFSALDYLSQVHERLAAIRNAYWDRLDALGRVDEDGVPAIAAPV